MRKEVLDLLIGRFYSFATSRPIPQELQSVGDRVLSRSGFTLTMNAAIYPQLRVGGGDIRSLNATGHDSINGSAVKRTAD